jgi:3-oxoacyl-(acyl-carrier-protein) synthase
MRHRVVITGMGVVTPIGTRVAEFRDNLLKGVSGAAAITHFDPAELPTRIAAEVKVDYEFCYRDRKITFAEEAAAQAYADAKVCGGRPGGARGGADGCISLGLGLELFSMPDLVTSRRAGFHLPSFRYERLTFLQTPSDLCVALIAHTYDLRRPPLIHTSACAAGTDAIGAAFHLVRSGRRRWVLAGGTDSMINPMGVGGFCKIGATTTANDHPERASRPLTATATVSCSAKAPGCWCWKDWRTPVSAVRPSTPR